MEQPQFMLAPRRNEDIALDMMKFIQGRGLRGPVIGALYPLFAHGGRQEVAEKVCAGLCF